MRINSSNLHFAGTTVSGPFAAVFEYDGNTGHTDGSLTVRTPQDNAGQPQTTSALITTNHYRKRRAPQHCGRYNAIASGLDRAVGEGGVDVAGALKLMDDVSFSNTLHTVILDWATRTLHVYISRQPGVSATKAEPIILDLNAVFDFN